MELQYFSYWISKESTLITVVAPLIAAAGGVAWFAISKAHRQANLAMALKLLMIGLLSVPVAHATSFWYGGGLHILPVSLLPFAYLVGTSQLNMRDHWLTIGFADWIAGVIPDTLGAWLKFSDVDTWYWGVGHFGFDDGLFVSPLMIVAALFAVEFMRDRKSKTLATAQ